MGGFDISSIKNAALRVFAESIDTDENNGGKIRGKLEERELSIFLTQGETRLKDNKTALAEFREIFNQLKDGWNHLISQDETNRTPYGEMSNVERYAEEGYRFTSTQELEDGTQTIRYDKEDGSYMVETLGSNKKEYYNDKGQLIKSLDGDVVEEMVYEGNATITRKTVGGVLVEENRVTEYNNRTVTITKSYAGGQLREEQESTVWHSSNKDGEKYQTKTETKYYTYYNGKKCIDGKETESGENSYDLTILRGDNGNKEEIIIKEWVDGTFYFEVEIDPIKNTVTRCEIGMAPDYSNFAPPTKVAYLLNNPDVPEAVKEKIRNGQIKLTNSETEQRIYENWRSPN